MNCQVSKTKRLFQRESTRNISSAKIKDCENIPVAESGAPRARPGDGFFQGQAGIIKLAGGSQAYKCPETEHPQDLSPTMRAKGNHRSKAIYPNRWPSREFNSWRLDYLRFSAGGDLSPVNVLGCD